MARLERTLRQEHNGRIRWRRATGAMAVVLLFSGAAVAISVVQNNDIKGLYGEVFGFDATSFVISAAVPQPSLGRTASGHTFGTGQEMSLAGGTANNGPAILDWEYRVTVSELSDGSVADPVANLYKATLYMNGVSQGSLYFDQAVNDVGVDTILLVYDIGASVPDSISFLVDIRSVAS